MNEKWIQFKALYEMQVEKTKIPEQPKQNKSELDKRIKKINKNLVSFRY